MRNPQIYKIVYAGYTGKHFKSLISLH